MFLGAGDRGFRLLDFGFILICFAVWAVVGWHTGFWVCLMVAPFVWGWYNTDLVGGLLWYLGFGCGLCGFWGFRYDVRCADCGRLIVFLVLVGGFRFPRVWLFGLVVLNSCCGRRSC